MENQNQLHQEYLSGTFKAADQSSLDDFDADKFTQQQTENLINEDFSNGYVADRKSSDQIIRNLNKITFPATSVTSGEYKSMDLSRKYQDVKSSNISTNEKLSNGDFIKQQMNNTQTIKAIKETFAGKQGILLLTVRNSIGASQGQLQVEDLESIFIRFGKVTVEVSNSSDNQSNKPNSIILNSSTQQPSAVLHFEDVVHAYFALISLHGLFLSSLNATLELRWKNDCSPNKENQEKDKKDSKPLSLQITKKSYELNQQENQETDENARPSQLSSNNNNNNKNPNSISYISKSQYQLGLQSSQYFQTDGNILRDSQANCQINIPLLSSSHQQHSQTIKQMSMQLLNNNHNTPQYSNNYNNSNTTFSNSILQQNNNNNSNNNGNGSNSNNNNNNNSGMKYTCRYEIQIPNDKDFQVARKIIGSRGENMKSIIRKCIEFGKKNGDQYANEEDHGVKLRLRGKGSGYKEGPEKQESSESLHLCVSSTYQEMYNAASFFVEELLQTIYDEYYKYCLQFNLRRDKLIVKKQESTNSKTSSSTTTPCASSGNIINQSQSVSSQPQQFTSVSMVPNLQKINSSHCNLSNSSQTQQQQLQISSFSELQQQQQQQQIQQQTYQSSQSQQQQFQTQYVQSQSQNLQQNQQQQQQQQQTQVIYPHLQQQTSTFLDIPDQSSNSIDDLSIRTSQTNIRLSEKQILKMIEQRNRARKESKFQEADNIRNYLKNNGVVLMDEKGGRGKGQDVTTWKYYAQNQHGSNGNSQLQQTQQYQPQQQHTYVPKAMVL